MKMTFNSKFARMVHPARRVPSGAAGCSCGFRLPAAAPGDTER